MKIVKANWDSYYSFKKDMVMVGALQAYNPGIELVIKGKIK